MQENKEGMKRIGKTERRETRRESIRHIHRKQHKIKISNYTPAGYQTGNPINSWQAIILYKIKEEELRVERTTTAKCREVKRRSHGTKSAMKIITNETINLFF